MLLRNGKLVASGETSAMVNQYLSDARKDVKLALTDWTDRITTGEATITNFEVEGRTGNHIVFGQDLRFRIYAEFQKPVTDPTFGLIIHDSGGVPLVFVHTVHEGLRLGKVDGKLTVAGMIPAISLYPGVYYLSPFIADSSVGRDIDYVRMCIELNIATAPGPHGDLKLDPTCGKFHMLSTWQLQQC